MWEGVVKAAMGYDEDRRRTERVMRDNKAGARTATIKQVAKQAGVSIATVSRAFADANAVSKALRDRVYKASRALNYRPSRIARNLRVGTSQTVGVVIPDAQKRRRPKLMGQMLPSA